MVGFLVRKLSVLKSLEVNVTIAPQGAAYGMVSATVIQSTQPLAPAKPATEKATLKKQSQA